jgi:hypothetical protein
MTFEWEHGNYLDGTLVYRQSEYSIDFSVKSAAQLSHLVEGASSTSLLFTTLQIEVAIKNGDLLYPWGLFPHTQWQIGRLAVPEFRGGRVRLIRQGDELRRGVSIACPGSDSWPVVCDKGSGWICLGDATPRVNAVAVEYARKAGVVLVDERIVSVWLQPEVMP